MRIASISIILLLIIIVTNFSMVFPIRALEIERHSKLLGDIVYNEIHSYNFFIEWLNEMKLLNINVIENPLEIGSLLDRETAYGILDKVYSNGRVATLIGGIQLRMLKKHTGLKPFINESDIANLIIAIIRDNNITLNYIHCDGILNKFILYIVHPFNSELRKSLCKWNINDLELYAKYILSLENSSPNSTMIINIIKYLYILRIAANNGNIDRDTLNRMLEEMSTRYSLITALFMKTFVYSYNIRIIDRGTHDRREKTHISSTPIIYKSDENRDINLTETLTKALLIIEKLKEKNIDMKDVDVFKLIDTLMNINIEEYHTIMNNLDDIINRISEHVEESSPHTQVDIAYNYSNEIHIDNQLHYYLEPWHDYENNMVLTQYNNFNKEISTNMDIDNMLKNESLAMDSQLLIKLLERDLIKEIIEYSNNPNVGIANTKIMYIPSINVHSSANKVILGVEFYTLLIIIVLIAIGVFLSIILLGKKIKSLFKQFIYVSRGFSTKSKMLQTKPSSIKIRVFIEFWSTIYKLAMALNLKVENSHTHREIKQLIISILNVNSLRLLLERATYLYEILRYGNEEDSRLLEELAEALSTIETYSKSDQVK